MEQPTSVMPKTQGAISAEYFPEASLIITGERPERPVYGLYTWGNEYNQHLASIAKIGFAHIRFSGPLTDAVMANICRQGQSIVYTVSSAKQATETDEEYIARYVNSVMTTLRKYGPNGTFFSDHPNVPYAPLMAVEITNEPNFQYILPNGTEAEREALYAKLLPTAYDAIKAEFPDVLVVGFATGGSSAGDLRFVEHVLKIDPTVAFKMDVFSTHPYVRSSPCCYTIESWGQYSIGRCLSILRQHFANAGRTDIPIWYTEMGWEISKADGGKYDRPEAFVTTPTLQAAHIVQTYALAMRLGVSAVDIMFCTDTDGYNGGFFAGANWRPSAYAVQTMATLMPNPRLDEIISDGEEGVFAYAFSSEENGDTIVMLWCPQGAQTVEFETEYKAMVVYDMLGNYQTISAIDGIITLPAGPCPLYLINP